MPVTVPSAWLSAHTPSRSATRKRGMSPARTARITRPRRGSICWTMSLSGFETHTDPAPARTAAAPDMTGTRAVTRIERGSTRATRHAVHRVPSTTNHTAPAPTPTLASPPSSSGTASAMRPATRFVAGSMRSGPGTPHVAVQTKPKPTSLPRTAPVGTGRSPPAPTRSPRRRWPSQPRSLPVLRVACSSTPSVRRRHAGAGRASIASRAAAVKPGGARQDRGAETWAASTCVTGTPVIRPARRGRSICSQRDTRPGSVETMTSS
jgi:hypothetical protein